MVAVCLSIEPHTRHIPRLGWDAIPYYVSPKGKSYGGVAWSKNLQSKYSSERDKKRKGKLGIAGCRNERLR